MNKFYVIRNKNTKAGFSSLLASVLGHLKLADDANRIPIVDWGYYKNLYSSAPFENSWNTYFEPVSRFNLANLTSSDDIIYRDDEPGNVLFPYFDNVIAKKYFKLFVKLNNASNSFINSRTQGLDMRNVLGVHFRASKEMRLKPDHPIQPTKQQMVKRIDQELNSGLYTKIFIATDSVRALEFFKKRYGKIIFSVKTSQFDANLFDKNREGSEYLYGLEFLTDLYLLSSCKQIVAGYSGVSNMAVVIRDEQTNSSIPNLIWNGRVSSNRFIAKYHSNLKRGYINFRIFSSLG